jgi:hypothetical protein
MKYIIILLIFISCNSQKKIIGLCADKFIIKDSIVYIDKYDTIFDIKQPDTLFLWDNKYIYDTTRIKTIKNIIKTKEKIVYRENKARVEQLSIDNKKLSENNTNKNLIIHKLKDQLRYYKTIRNLIISILVLAIFFSIYIKTISKKWL